MTTKSSSQTRPARFKGQRILVPVDFSDSSARALRHAAKQAAESGGSLIIVHVVPADYGWLGIGRDELRDLDRSLQQQASDRLRAFVNENVGDDVAADLEVRVGQPAKQIVAAARDSKCDSIVLSTRGLTGLDRFLIGSVAHRVAQLAPCSVVLVRPGKRARQPKQKAPAVLRIKREAKTPR
jgi:nucleotide-binding universal stress UspA family protein